MPEDRDTKEPTKAAPMPGESTDETQAKMARVEAESAEEQPKLTGKEAPKFVVYQAGDAVASPSGNMEWSEAEWDARDPDGNYFRVEGTKAIR